MRALLSQPMTSHAMRIALWIALWVLASTLHELAVLVASAALFFTLFSCFHDAAHGALGLSRRTNDALLFVLSAPLFMSTHAQRQLHMRHHARPLAHDDVEGVGARLRFVHALVASPLLAGPNVVEGCRAVPAKLRALVALEWSSVAAVAVYAVSAPTSAFAMFVFVVASLQLMTAFWASHIPHHPPRVLVAIALRLVAFKDPVVLSLLFHREHHAHPRVPCAWLTASVPLAAAPAWSALAR